MSLRSPLGRVRGLGSAKNGVSHYIQQNLTAIALVPLSLWFVVSIISLIGADYAHFHAWISTPCNTTLLLVLLFVMFHHAQLGVQMVIEDYVHDEGIKTFSIVAVKFASALVCVFSAVAVFRVAFVGG